MNLMLTMAVSLAVFALCFLAIGLGVFLGKRKDIKGCSCSFDADRSRADAQARRCCGEHAKNCPSHSPEK